MARSIPPPPTLDGASLRSPAARFPMAPLTEVDGYNRSRSVRAPPPPNFSHGAKLAPSIFLPDVDVAHLSEASLRHARQQTSRALKQPVILHLIRCARIDNVPFSYLVAVECRGCLRGVYEVCDYGGGVRCNRVCDKIVEDLLAGLGSFPGISCKLDPINGFAGSPRLHSGASPDLIVGFC